jgi:hypothetical protein
MRPREDAAFLRFAVVAVRTGSGARGRTGFQSRRCGQVQAR